MKILNTDFTLDKYGLSVRLVKEEDAEFIVKLRTNENLNSISREFNPKERNLSRVSPVTLKKNLALTNARPTDSFQFIH